MIGRLSISKGENRSPQDSGAVLHLVLKNSEFTKRRRRRHMLCLTPARPHSPKGRKNYLGFFLRVFVSFCIAKVQSF